jgi:hypothetical protein
MGLFNRNSVKTDNEELPETRKQQFWLILKDNWLLLFYVSLTYFVFTVPLFYFQVSTYMVYSEALQDSASTASQLFSIVINGALLAWPCFLVLALGSAGINNVVKSLALGQPAWYKDFWRGIKENWWKFLLVYFFFGFFVFLLFLNYASYYYLDINVGFKLAGLIISSMLLFFFLLIKPYLIFQILLFSSGFNALVKNSFLLAMTKFYRNIGCLIASNGLYILLFFFTTTVRIFTIVLIIMFGGAFSALLNFINCLSILESNFSKDEIPAIYHKGLKE